MNRDIKEYILIVVADHLDDNLSKEELKKIIINKILILIKKYKNINKVLKKSKSLYERKHSGRTQMQEVN